MEISIYFEKHVKHCILLILRNVFFLNKSFIYFKVIFSCRSNVKKNVGSSLAMIFGNSSSLCCQYIDTKEGIHGYKYNVQ